MAIRPSVETLRSLGNFTQLFRWTVEFEKFPALVTGYTSDDINFRAVSATQPALNVPAAEIQIRGNKVFEHGIGEYVNPFTLTCAETVDNKISKFIHEWQEACWQTADGSTGKSNPKHDVEAVILLTRLDNMDNPIFRYKLIGAILVEPDPGGDLDEATADPLKPVLNIQYDYFNRESLV